MVMRVGGLASGMDIDSIVEKLMQTEKAPLNKLYQNKQKYEWQRDSYREVNKQLKAFDDFLFPGMTLQKDFYKKNATSSNDAVSAVPTTAGNGQILNIGNVTQLATAGTGVNKVTESSNIKAGTAGSSTLADLNIVAAGNTQGIALKVLQEDGSFKNVDLQFSGADTINSVVKKLKDEAGLNAFYDERSGQIALSSKVTGKGEEVNLGGTPEVKVNASVVVEGGFDFFQNLGFENKALVHGGKNAQFTINGATIERQSNTFELDGFKVTLNDEYTGNQPITLTTKTDADNMVDKIKKFVETYNGLIESFTTMTKEPRYRDYPPLTEEQKADMEEKEIENWEKKAKSGALRGDSLVSGVLSAMRSTMYSSGGGKQDNRATGENFINTLYEMGITTSSKMSDNGKLEIDEDKLREAIEKDPDQVFKTFSESDAGIVQKLRKDIDKTVKLIEKKAGKADDSTNMSFQIGRQIDNTDDRIDLWKMKLENFEARYWKQFTAMETAINKANTQSSTLFSGQQM